MNKRIFEQYIKHPELLNNRSVDELQQIIDEYPFFQTARLLLLKNFHNQGSIKYEKELKRTAVWTTDRRKLFHLLDHRVLLPVFEEKPLKLESPNEGISETIDFIQLSKAKPLVASESKPQTEKFDELDELIMAGSAVSGTFFDVDDKIDLADFKNTFGKKKEENETAEENPGKKKETVDNSRRNSLIDSFIENQPRISKVEELNIPIPQSQNEPTSSENDMMTDTLAKIYIKQGFHEKAIHTYEKLSLKYPEKNAYFADQIEKIKESFNNQ